MTSLKGLVSVSVMVPPVSLPPPCVEGGSRDRLPPLKVKLLRVTTLLPSPLPLPSKSWQSNENGPLAALLFRASAATETL